MKKLTLIAACLSLSFFGVSQVPNGGFETWQTETESSQHYSVPQHWVSEDELANYIFPLYTGVSVSQTATSHSGSSAVLLQTVINNSDTVGGTIYSCDSLAQIIRSLSSGKVAGFPYATRSANLQGYYKFNGVGNDSAVIAILFTKWNGAKRDTLVFTHYETGTNQASYILFNAPLNYKINYEYPDTAAIVAQITGPHGKKSHVGTTVYLDDLSFTGTVTLGINELSNKTGNVSVYPNPFSSSAILNVSQSIKLTNATIEIYNALGQTVKTIQNVNTNNVTIERGNLLNGIYFYRLLNSYEPISSGKFIIQ